MPPQTLIEANQLVLRIIDESGSGGVLGFLPLSLAEEDAVLDLVKTAARGAGVTIRGLLSSAPAATAYALAVAPSRTLTTGGNFWPALATDLGVRVDLAHRAELSLKFRTVVSQLGLLDGTLEEAAWIHAAPFIFQAGILHFWKASLAAGLQSTMRHVPVPDLQDPGAFRGFADNLRTRIINQSNLTRVLETDVGPILVRRLATAYVTQNWSVLPAHLQEPIREAFAQVGRGVVVNSPYLSFDPAFRQLQVVLPEQSHRIASPETEWRINGRRYSARAKRVIPFDELNGGSIQIRLCKLLGEFSDQNFALDVRFNQDVPFRVFRKDTGRERRSEGRRSMAVPPGEYLVVMIKELLTNDEANVESLGELRILEIEFRPGYDDLVLTLGDATWRIQTSLRPGVYLDHSVAHSIPLKEGGVLHFGQNLGIIAYFPSANVNVAQCALRIRCADQGLDQKAEVSAGNPKGGAFVFQTNLDAPIAEALEQLPPGIHRLEFSLSHAAAGIDHTLWYWKGLDYVSNANGFHCSATPSNLDIAGCRGLVLTADGVGFKPDHHAPTVTLALTNPRQKLRFPCCGVEVIISEHGVDWEESPHPETPLVVMNNDKRLLCFRADGYQRWEIRGNGKRLKELEGARSTYAISLAGLATELGGSGRIEARDFAGKSIQLLTFSRPLTATAPKCSPDRGQGMEVWKFQLPSAELHELGVSITDLSDAPPSIGPDRIDTLLLRKDNSFIQTIEKFGWENDTVLVVTPTCKDVGGVWHHEIADALDAALEDISPTPRKIEIEVTVTIYTEVLRHGFLSIDFYRRTSEGGDWLVLDCTEKYGYSALRILAWSQPLSPGADGWWRKLRLADAVTQGDLTLSQMTLPNLTDALAACRDLLSWKYPTEVWKFHANRLQDWPVRLGRHRFDLADGSAAIWWGQGVMELSEYAAASLNPVARQFLIGSQLHCLLIPRKRMEVGMTKAFATPVGRSLNLPAKLHAAGSIKEFVLAGVAGGELPEEVIFCFSNFLAVNKGTESEFKGFSLPHYLRGTTGIEGLEKRVETLYETAPRFEVKSLLGPEHLLHAVRALNRRCRSIEQAVKDTETNPLTRFAQEIERMAQRVDNVAPGLSQLLGWTGSGPWCWCPPRLENECSKKVAELVWLVAAISRLAANGKLTAEEFDSRIKRLLANDDPASQNIQGRLCMLLSLAPELFGFYFALFELQFSVGSP